MSAAPALRVFIVDDESPARMRLARLVAECPSPRAEVAGEAANATQALVWLAGHRCDVVLADIAMPGRDGLQLAAELARLPDAPAVVFVTAHAGHALAAFDLAAVDYLTKPVRRERLHAALQRAAARRGVPADWGGADGSSAAAAANPATRVPPVVGEPVLVVHEAGRLLRIPAAEVLYLKAEQKYVTLRTARATHLLDEPLAELEQRLGGRFLRVHRNALVARDAIRAVERRTGAAGHRTAVCGGATGEATGRPTGHALRAGVADADADRPGGVRTPRSDRDDDGEGGWSVLVEPVGERLQVSRRQVAAVRDAVRDRR